jgi:two-component system CheB/CheR fusion protein
MTRRKRTDASETSVPSPQQEGFVKKDAPSQQEENAPRTKESSTFPIVGIGASAGGLAAFEAFFANMPAHTESGMAFVLVQHLDPDHKSILADLVKRYTRMKVYEIEDGTVVEPNCAYIIPPNRDLALLHGKLHLMEPVAARGLRLPIDLFFRSLAQDQHERAICIVFSGTGSDGTLGLKAIKGEGGMAMAQDPQSTKYDGMPRSAIQTGLVDYVLPPEKMPEQLIAYVQHAFGQVTQRATAAIPQTIDALQKIFILLRAHTGHDFTHYKQNTVLRRIERRMAVNQIEYMDGYVRYLQQNPLELEALFRELLIGVTNFFRDPEAFEALMEQAIPRLVAAKSAGETLRVWVPGCSTGEEAYSIAILLREAMDELRKDFRIQVFATDIDGKAIEKARRGVYPDSISADISPERLARFFAQEDNTYRIRKTIRDAVVFAEQNVIEDPPFSRMDLISCRNLLIYFGPELQKKVVRLFHYSLHPDGFLLLGNSESIGEFVDLFATVDRKWKLFQRKGVATPRAAIIDLPSPSLIRDVELAGPGMASRSEETADVRELTERTLLEAYSPPCAIINEKAQVLYIHGRTGRYLEPAPGEATLSILKMAREGLRLELTAAIRKAIAEQNIVSHAGLRVKANGETYLLDLTVQPVTKPASMRGLMMVIFEDATPKGHPQASETIEPVADKDQRIADLEQDLRAQEEYLQSTIEELETAYEELKSSNEELQSSNEELQSTNEELETSKEELQSVNEELVTVNMELQNKLDELAQANNDMNNLMAATGIGTIFVDRQLRIQRFTPAATKVINLIRTDIGRPVVHVVSNLVDYDQLAEDVQAVLDTLTPKETEIQSRDGLWYIVRILPYRTLEDVIGGAVISFVDITEQRRTMERLRELSRSVQEEREFANSIVDTIREPLVILNADLNVVSASRSFYESFQVDPDETEGRFLSNLGDGQWNIPELRRLLEEVLPEKTTFSGLEVKHNFENIGMRTMRLNAREVHREAGRERLILLAIEDVTAG